MNRLSMAALFLIIALSSSSFTKVCLADIGEWTREPIWDVSGVAFADDYSHPQFLWIALSGGQENQLFSYDRIEEYWTEVTYPADNVSNGLYTTPYFPNLLFVVDFRNLYKSDNGGLQWSEVYSLSAGHSLREVFYQPSYERFIMLISDGEILVSYDQCDNWTPLETNLLGTSTLFMRQIDDCHHTLFIGRSSSSSSNDTILYRSVDGGSHWVASGEGLPNDDHAGVYDITRSSIDTTKYFLAEWSGLFKSLDNGWTWFRIEPELMDTLMGTVVENPTNNYHLCAMHAWGWTNFYESFNAGESWQRTTSFLPLIQRRSLWFSPDSSSEMMVGGLNGLYRRTNSDSSFTPVMLPREVPFAIMSAIERGPQGTLWIQLGHSTLRSTDEGVSWLPSYNYLGSFYPGNVLCSDPVWDTIVYRSTLYMTADHGESWAPIGGETFDDATSKAMAINEEIPDHLVVTVSADRRRVYYSENQGDTFIDITGSLSNHPYQDVIILNTEPETIMISMSGFAEGGIFATTNYGQTWERRDGNGMLGTWVWELKVDPRTGYIYANNGDLWYSPDSGSTWVNCMGNMPGRVEDMVFDPGPDGDIYVISGNYGVYRGDGFSGNWDAFFEYSPDTVFFNELLIDPTPPWTIYAKTLGYDGLFSWTEPDSATIHPDAQMNKPGNYALGIESYPNPFNQECRITVRLETIPSTQTKITGEVYNILGQSVKRLDFRQTSPSSFEALWQGKDANDIPLSSGIYLVRIAYGNVKTTGKILLMH